jgi:hypothetical protein
MTSRDPFARRSTDSFIALFGPVIATLPWIILYLGGLFGYLAALAGFALIMAFLNRRELSGRVRNWRAASKSKSTEFK